MADPKLPGIYVIRNTVNGKCYVGSAIRIARRWCVHRSDLKTGVHRCKPLQRAYDKHGAAAFIFEVLEFVPDLTDLISREQHWMDTLDSHCERSGYNVCPVAESSLGMKMPESAKRAIGLASRGRNLSEEQKATISACHKGKTISQEHRDALTRSFKDKLQAPGHIAKRAAAHRALNRTMSDEHRQHVSEVHKGKTLAQYQKDAVSKASKARWAAFRAAGSKMSAEARTNMSAAARLREAVKREARATTVTQHVD